MTFQIQRIGDSYGVLFTEEQMRLAGLSEGTEVDVQPHPKSTGTAPDYVPFDEGMRAYKRTEPQWSASYDELAK